MKRTVLFLIVLIFTSDSLVAQTTHEGKDIMDPITKLFAGMSSGDSALVHSAFANEPTMVTVTKDKNGTPVLITDGLKKFLVAVGTPHPESWNEPVWDAKIQVDGHLAQVWVKYAFYLEKKFSHCGVDAFHLFKDPTGNWKIFHLADTRQREGCEVPKEISERFK